MSKDMDEKIEIAILGADGRMGRAVMRAVDTVPHAVVTVALSAPTSPFLGQDLGQLSGLQANGVPIISNVKAALDACDVVIDFSAPEASLAIAQAILDAQTNGGGRCQTLVSGTTGYTESEAASLSQAAERLTLLQSGNFSLGITMLEALVERATQSLSTGWDVEILDMHHKHKIDAPSGTALMLGEAAARGRNVELKNVQILSRQGRSGARSEGQIGFAALRGGGLIGAHDVRIASELEMISLSHQAFDRSVFANGAVTAALWAVHQPAGHYDMKDVLGL